MADGASADMGSSPGVSDGDPGRQLSCQEVIGDLGHHWQLATLQMVGAFRIHDNPVRSVDGDDGRIECQCPEGDPFQRRGIRDRIRIDQHQPAKQRLRFRGRHADAYPGLLRSRIRGRHPALRAAFRNHGDRLFRRNGRIVPANTIGRQIR
ncbi:hypothetical protein D3C71_1459970 [compost metagenome]